MSAITLRLYRMLDIRPGESRMVALIIGIMLFTSAGFTLGSTSVEALFYARYGVQYLPGMYMLLGITSFITSLGMTALLGRLRHEAFYIYVPIGIAILTVVAWALLFSGWSIIYPVLWLGKEIINSLITLVVWGLAGAVCNTRQSKRLFPLFNAGRILGSVVGGLGTGVLVSLFGTHNLLLIWAGLLVLAFFITRALIRVYMRSEPVLQSFRSKRQGALIHEMQQGWRFVRSSLLMRWVSLAAILFSILYFSIALPFSKGAAAAFPDVNSLASFLGLFNGLTTGAAFLVSFLAANRLYARFGIMTAILALPVIYLLGFGGLVLTQAFLFIVLFRFVQTVWLNGMADSAYQAMFNAVPAKRRDQVRSFIGGVPEQAGTFLAGAILIVGQQAFSSRELALVGLAAAAATTFVIWRARAAYTHSLVDSLRLGQPTLFASDDRTGMQPDADAIHISLDGLHNPDPLIRHFSAEMLGQVDQPAAITALVESLRDQAVGVRAAALKGLARPEAAAALLEISGCLGDSAEEVRARAVDALPAMTPYPHSLRALLAPLLEDPAASVRVRAAVALLKLGGAERARSLLRQMAMLGSLDERVMALHALAEVGDSQAQPLFEMELADLYAPAEVRQAAAWSLGSCGPAAIPALMEALGTQNEFVQAGVANALGQIGEAALPAVLDSLMEPALEPGALAALEQLPAWTEAARVRGYAKKRVETSLHYEALREALPADGNDRMGLLHESLAARARRDGLSALRALGVLSDHETLAVAVENLQSRNPAQLSNAVETLDSIRAKALIRPLLRIWDPGHAGAPALAPQAAIAELVEGQDAWLRACAAYAIGKDKEDQSMEDLKTLSSMERVLLLRCVPLLEDLTPEELQRVAAISTDQDFEDGEKICEQGETGDLMFVIISGEARVVVTQAGQPEKEIARRAAGDVVGEMSIISGEPRLASVISVGDVHTLCLERLHFESLLRERPEISLAVMRELCKRIKNLL
jgi:HEAT repeat protein